MSRGGAKQDGRGICGEVRRHAPPAAGSDGQAGDELHAVPRERIDAFFRDRVDLMPDVQSRRVVLLFLAGKSQREIADALGLKPTTVYHNPGWQNRVEVIRELVRWLIEKT